MRDTPELNFRPVTSHVSPVTIFVFNSGILAFMAIELQQTATGAILYDSERIGKPNEEIFDAEYWSSQNKIVARASGRGSVIFIRDGEHHWALRHYRRGGLIGKWVRDAYLWTGAEHTRAFREWRLLHELHTKNLPVPAPVATRYVRSGIFYRADIMTEALPAVRTLADSITGVELRSDRWKNIGATIAKFHRFGVRHADLNAHNILLGEGGTVFVLDFDRGRLSDRGAWEEKVLARLKRSLFKIRRQRSNVFFSEREWEAFVEGYSVETQDTRRETRSGS